METSIGSIYRGDSFSIPLTLEECNIIYSWRTKYDNVVFAFPISGNQYVYFKFANYWSNNIYFSITGIGYGNNQWYPALYGAVTRPNRYINNPSDREITVKKIV